MSRQSSNDGDITGSDLPPGAVLGDPVVDDMINNAGDLGHTTDRLRLREQALLAEHERNAAALAAIGSVAEVTGRGEAADGAVVVETDADNRMTDLQLDPRALRLGSIENLRTAIMDAYAAAADDAAAHLADAALGDMPPDSLRAMLDSMPELTAIMPEEAWERYLDPAPSERDDSPPPRRARPAEDQRPAWQERNPYV